MRSCKWTTSAPITCKQVLHEFTRIVLCYSLSKQGSYGFPGDRNFKLKDEVMQASDSCPDKVFTDYMFWLPKVINAGCWFMVK